LSPSDLLVVQGDKLIVLTSADDLRNFFLATLRPIGDEATAVAAGQSWLRLSSVFTQDGFYTFSDPVVSVMEGSDGGLIVLGEIWVTGGGEGGIAMVLDINADEEVTDIIELRDVLIGIRPL
jgi:hypothetical protein